MIIISLSLQIVRKSQEETNLYFVGLKENVKEVLTNLCQRHNVPSVKKLAYLNAIVKLISETDSQDYGYSTEDLFCW